MRFIVNREALAEALDFMSAIAMKKHQKAALTAVKIVARDKQVEITATDHTISARWVLSEADVMEPGEACIPAERLAGLVGGSRDPVLTFETDAISSGIFMKGDKSNIRLFGVALSDFPAVDEYTPNAADLAVDTEVLAGMIKKVKYAASMEPHRYAINSVLFEPTKNALTLAATNGHAREAFVRGDVINGMQAPGMTVSLRSVALLEQLLTEKAICRIRTRGFSVTFAIFPTAESAVPTVVLTAALVEGTFPPYLDIVPKTFTRKAVLNRSTLVWAAKQASRLTNEESQTIRLAFTADNVQLSSRAPERGEATIDVPAELEGEPVEIGLHAEFLLESLNAMQGDRLTIEILSPLKPVKLTCDPHAVAIIMPANLAAAAVTNAARKSATTSGFPSDSHFPRGK